MTQIRPRRSVLYMPGSNARAMVKAQQLRADGLIFDLEDAVAPDEKQLARAQITTALAENEYGQRERIMRINGLATKWGYDDCVAAAQSGADVVLIPKVENAGDIKQVEEILSASGAPQELAIWCMIETPLGVLNVQQIAFASPRIGCLVMGTSDLGKELRAEQSPDRMAFLTGLSLCLLAARAAGLAILDGVHLDLNDDAGFVRSCEQGRMLGFDGKTLIHPKTIAPCNQAFSPSPEALHEATRIVAAYRSALAEGKGVVLLDGKLIENLHVVNAERLLRLGEMVCEFETHS